MTPQLPFFSRPPRCSRNECVSELSRNLTFPLSCEGDKPSQRIYDLAQNLEPNSKEDAMRVTYCLMLAAGISLVVAPIAADDFLPVAATSMGSCSALGPATSFSAGTELDFLTEESWYCTVYWYCGGNTKSGTASGSSTSKDNACHRARASASNQTCPRGGTPHMYDCECTKSDAAEVFEAVEAPIPGRTRSVVRRGQGGGRPDRAER